MHSSPFVPFPVKHLVTIPGLVLLLMLTATPAVAQSTLYWMDSENFNIRRADADGSNAEDIIRSRLEEPNSIEVDLTSGMLYWAAIGEVGRAALDGSGVEAPVVLPFDPPFRSRAATVAPHESDQKIYWVSNDAIQRADQNGANSEVVISQGLDDVQDIDIDEGAGRIYWIDNVASGGIIRRANLDGSGVETLVDQGFFSLKKIVLDPAGGKMYFTDLVTNEVSRANLDGSNVETLIDDLENPNGLALDSDNNRMYWTDVTDDAVYRADLDGANMEEIVFDFDDPTISLIEPVDVAIDTSTDRLYVVVDRGTVYSSDLDGSNAGVLILPVGSFFQSEMDVHDGKIYFTADQLMRADLDGSGVEIVARENLRNFALDKTADKIYWSGGTVTRADLDGANSEELVETDDAFGISIAPGIDRMFWYDDDPDEFTLRNIFAASLDGTNTDIIVADVDPIGKFALDATDGFLFWNDQASGDIFRSELDGTAVTPVVEGSSSSLVPVPELGKLYWSFFSIMRADLDGSNAEELLENVDGVNLTIDVDSDRMYWANRDGEIRRANLDGTNVEVVATGVASVQDILIVSDVDTAVDESPETPDEISLTTIYPNPFRDRTTLRLQSPSPQSIEIALYAVTGEKVAVIYSGPLPGARSTEFTIDGSALPGGVYLYRVSGESIFDTGAITLVR